MPFDFSAMHWDNQKAQMGWEDEKKANSGGGISSGEVGNYFAGVDYVAGATGNNLAIIVGDRAKYGKANPKTIVRTAVINVEVSTKGLASTSTILKSAGVAAGLGGLTVKGYQFYHRQISWTEASFDAAFGAIGFFGPVGAGVIVLYFGSKFLYEYSTGETVFVKPEGN